MCHYVFMYDERDKNARINVLIKYISNTRIEMRYKIKSIATRYIYI